MLQTVRLLSFILASGAVLLALPQDDEVVFRSDVSLARIDAQVVDSNNGAITQLNAEDFVLRLDGRAIPIRNFASEGMPVDVLFLLDVSASMRPHVQRIADASGQALTVLGKDDRMGIMVFDRYTRVRLPFSSSHQDVQREFDRLLRQEGFNGGTDITRAMLDAAAYLRRTGRRDARRAIVILTDDRTEFDRNDTVVGQALARADAVMCALIAPDAMQQGRYPGGAQPRGTWGTGPGVGVGGSLGGIVLGPRSRGPGGGPYPGSGGGMGGPHTKTAGTSEIARDSGGDSMSVNDASALEETLARIRQRYTLYFNLPEGLQQGQERNIEVDLTAAARLHRSDAEVRYRRVFQSSNGGSDVAPVRVTHAPARPSYSNSSAPSTDTVTQAVRRRRVAVNEDGTVSVPDDAPAPPPVQPAPNPQSPSPTPSPSPNVK